MTRIKWETEELVALLDIYDRKLSNKELDVDHELHCLSSILNRRADFLKIAHDETYRNYSGMKMMYQNLLYVASGKAQGLPNASDAMYIVFDLYKKCPEAYKLILNDFCKRYVCV